MRQLEGEDIVWIVLIIGAFATLITGIVMDGNSRRDGYTDTSCAELMEQAKRIDGLKVSCEESH